MLRSDFSAQAMGFFTMQMPRSIADARSSGDAMERALAKLQPECVSGSAREADGVWVGSGHAQGVPSVESAHEYSLDAPVETRVVRAAMDRQGWTLLDKVEVRDADGKWQLAWSGAQPAAPAGCDYMWFKQALANNAQIGAVRLVFRREIGSFTAGDVAVLKAAR